MANPERDPERRTEALSDLESESSGEEEGTDTVSLEKLQALGKLTPRTMHLPLHAVQVQVLQYI